MPISKSELKKELQAMGIKVVGNYINKKDLNKIISEKTTKVVSEKDAITWAKKMMKIAEKYANEGFGGFLLELALVKGEWVIGLDWLNDLMIGEITLGQECSRKQAEQLHSVIKKILDKEFNIYTDRKYFEDAVKLATK